MTTASERRRLYEGPALFSLGFRPFFLGASVFAGFAAPAWMILFAAGAQPFGALSALEWHAHEMLFGFLGAVVTGFLLTAVPNWTGRLPVFGTPLAALFGLWLLGRVAMASYAILGPIAAVIDASFLFAVAALVWREVLAGDNTRNLPVCAVVTVLALANALHHAARLRPGAHEAGEHLAVAAMAFLIALIGGRITPSFTRTWLKARGETRLPAAADRFDLAVLALTGLALAVWISGAPGAAAGGLLVAAGLGLAGRLARWRGVRTSAEPLVLILHVGYGWLAAGVGLLGLSALAPAAVPEHAALHAILAGAAGVMVLAVMTRASRGHTGRALKADAATVVIYTLVNAGAGLRVAAYFLPEFHDFLLWSGGALWSAAFGLFAIAYGPMLASPRADR